MLDGQRLKQLRLPQSCKVQLAPRWEVSPDDLAASILEFSTSAALRRSITASRPAVYRDRQEAFGLASQTLVSGVELPVVCIVGDEEGVVSESMRRSGVEVFSQLTAKRNILTFPHRNSADLGRLVT